MIRVSVTVETDILDAIAETAQKSPRLMQTAFKRNVSRLRSRILDDLTQDPGPVHYPIRWKSERQRRAFFATNGFGKGIPYERTGALQAGYRITAIDDPSGGILQVTNTTPYANFVVGDDAQPFHLDTGWRQVGTAIANYREEAEDILIDTWFTVTDATAGVFR
jgi:hypothetical protein